MAVAGTFNISKSSDVLKLKTDTDNDTRYICICRIYNSVAAIPNS
jgi:hypothetical protein